MNRSLIIFAREPLPGRVKTRLAASIGYAAAAEQYQAMLRDVLQSARQLEDVETVVYWACDPVALPMLAERYSCRSRRQGTGDLGQRMQAAFAELLAEGYQPCCIIGSDAPDLPTAYLQEAFTILESQQADAVFGPSSDGGYYLLGLNQRHPALFSEIAWGSPAVLQQSLAAAERLGLTTRLLPEWYDVDTAADLQALQERRRSLSPAAAVAARQPHQDS